MVPGKMPLSSQSPLAIDFELESVPIGSAARMIVLETDPEGGLFYQFGRRKAQHLQLPSGFGLSTVGIIDLLHTAAILDPATQRLRALAIFSSDGPRILLFGGQWGQWLDEQGQIHHETNLPETLKMWKTSVLVQEVRQWITFDFVINIYYHEIFSQESILTFREGPVYHTLKLCFDYPSGKFAAGRVAIHDKDNHRVNFVFELDQFPLNWPQTTNLPLISQPRMRPGAPSPHPANNNAQPHPARPAQAPPRHARTATPSPMPPPAPSASIPPATTPPEPPPKAAPDRPLSPTEHLSVHELLSVLSTEINPDRRWRIIESNLMLVRPERTYPMIQRYPDLIAEHVRVWMPDRLRRVFSNQPGSVLIHIMHDWLVNQVMAVSEDNAESSRILEWLREREIERLLHMDLTSEPQTPVQARRVLRVDRNADAQAIKKTWRMLLSFLNVDHGRSQERAIHRHKDEIAKHIQAARDILMKSQ